MPKTGRPFSVRMTNGGSHGWVSDQARGYRYEARHPVTDSPWPEIPPLALAAWSALTRYPKPPQACLVNLYDAAARMGLHQDRDETDLAAPILSLSLGADCRFKIAARRTGPSCAFLLRSGDALVMGGAARLAFHGVDKILPTLSPLRLPGGAARINLTLRRVD